MHELEDEMAGTASTAVNTDTLGDETFMSADDLRKYMTDMEMAKVSHELSSMDKAEQARQELLKALQAKIEVTPKKIAEIKQSLSLKLRNAAQRGETEVMVMRFPNSLCTDKGRAINNSEPDWPETLTGRPRQAYEFWREHLRPAKFTLKALIVDWPAGLPGDVAFFLSWA
jgi:hypothetical protein